MRIPEEVLESLHGDPKQITTLLYPDITTAASNKKTILGWLSRPRKTKSEIRLVADWSIPECDMMDIDKAWHGLHFIFTGSDWSGGFPEGFLVTCGKAVGDVDVGYGPARFLTSPKSSKLQPYRFE